MHKSFIFYDTEIEKEDFKREFTLIKYIECMYDRLSEIKISQLEKVICIILCST